PNSIRLDHHDQGFAAADRALASEFDSGSSIPRWKFSGRNHDAGLRSGSPAFGPFRHPRRQGRRVRLRSPRRPGRRMGREAAFSWFGQLSELATDPTPMRIMRQIAPFTDHWLRRLDDASGVEGEWYPREQALSGMAEELLAIAGELYLPFLVANAEAFAKGM